MKDKEGRDYSVYHDEPCEGTMQGKCRGEGSFLRLEVGVRKRKVFPARVRSDPFHASVGSCSEGILNLSRRKRSEGEKEA